MKFKLDEKQVEKLIVWKKEQNKKVAEKQDEAEEIAAKNKEYIPSFRMKREAYYGACGGGYEYIFAPCSLGMGVSVRNTITGEEINLSDYENW